MADKQIFSGTSKDGDLSEALSAAITAASQALNANYFSWQLESISGSVGGIVNAHDVSVTISTSFGN